MLAHSHTLTAADALVIIDHSLSVNDFHCLMTAILLAYLAADATLEVDHRLR